MDTRRDEEELKMESPKPANPSIVPEKAEAPDADRTDSATLPDEAEEASTPIDESTTASEHTIGRDHAEPTDVTGTTNDDYIDGEYIDVGGPG
jgi:hypothetical protein